MQKIKPLFDRVLCEPETEHCGNGKIYIPTTQTERSQIMRVVAIGDTDCVAVGEKIIINKYSGAEITTGNTKQYIVKSIDILGVIKE
ncbi:MAG: co-chaperone GroES [Christensenellaceae bacterium]|jgi:co-chaperonin GroES (HSP10)|nr:co-chaperone GroES [Christensenellaceae bacterium]